MVARRAATLADNYIADLTITHSTSPIIPGAPTLPWRPLWGIDLFPLIGGVGSVLGGEFTGRFDQPLVRLERVLSGTNASPRRPLGARQMVATIPREIDQLVHVIFIAADPARSRRDELCLPGYYSVIEAPTVDAAAALSQRHPLDLLILDLGMPVARGLAMLRQLKADPRLQRAPLVLFGAFADMTAIRRGLELGARDYVITGETSPCLVARRVPGWLDDAPKQAVKDRSSRPPRHGGAPAVPAPHRGLAELFGGSLVGLVLLLLSEKRFLLLDRTSRHA